MSDFPVAFLSELRNRWKGSIGFRHTIGLSLTILLIMGIASAVMIYEEGKTIRKAAEVRGLAFSRSFALIGAAAVLDNLYRIQDAMDQYLDPDILQLDVVDKDNMIVASKDLRRIGILVNDQLWLSTINDQAESLTYTQNTQGDPILVIVEPLFEIRSPAIRQGNVGAWIRVTFSLVHVRHEELQAIARMALVTLVLIATGVLGVQVAQRQVSHVLRGIIGQLQGALISLGVSVSKALTGEGNTVVIPQAPRSGQGEFEYLTGVVTGTNELLKIQSDALRESEIKFRSVAQSASDAIISGDRNGNIISWNNGAEHIFGYAEEEILGKPLTLLMPERYRDDHLRGLERLSLTGEAHIIGKTLELSGVRKDGTEFPLELSLATWKTGEGTFYSGIIRDITERKRAEELLRKSEERFALAVQGSSDGLWDASPLPDEPWSSPRTPVWYSTRFKQMLGYEEHEFEHVLGSWAARLHPADRDRVFAAVSAHIERKVPYDVEYRLRTKQGEYRWFSARGQAIWDDAGNFLRIAGSLRDITDRKQTEEALQALTVSLEQKVQERTAELEIARDHALMASRHKSEFLANMSHELRTPLNAVIGFSDMLLEKMFGDLNQKQVEYVHDILSSGRHLLELINDILDLSKVESGRMDLELTTFDLQSAIESTLTLVRERAHRRGVNVALQINHGLGEFTADERKIKQILLNLLSNAVKFTPSGGRVLVRATLSVEAVEIAVTDTGVGIAPEDQEKIFEEFYQVHGTGQKREGTGLGLALAKKFVELHGGRIWVESVVGRGSTFTFTLLRRAPLEKVSAPGGKALAAPVKGPTVLVVEDDPSATKLLSAYLMESGFIVEIAQDGETGFEKAQAIRPAIITLDVLMPKVDGWDLLARLKGNPKTVHIPVVIVSIVDERGKGFALGAAEYLVKPVHRDELLSAIRRVGRIATSHHRDVTILAIDDDPMVLELMEAVLVSEGFSVLKATGGTEGVALARERHPNLIILDLLLPDLDGFQVVDELKRHPMTADIQILILTCKTLSKEEKNRLNGRISDLKQKGDFNRTSFVAQVRALLQLRES